MSLAQPAFLRGRCKFQTSHRAIQCKHLLAQVLRSLGLDLSVKRECGEVTGLQQVAQLLQSRK